MASRFTRLTLLAGMLATPMLPLTAMAPAELAERLARNEPVLLVDVRPAHHYAEGHIPGAINIPLALLPHKALPATMPVVVYADGIGQVDDAAALAAANAKNGVKADVLEGGYAAWLAQTRLSTQAAGVSAERLPVITYDQLTAGTAENVVLVDLRSEAGAKTAASAGAGARAMSVENDDVADFAARFGMSVVKAPDVLAGTPAGGAGSAVSVRSAGARTAGGKAALASRGGQSETGPTELLVLVAEDEAEAAALARQLRASGQYRFTVLIGGVEAIRHQGRTGLGRMDGRTGAAQP